MVHNTTEQFDEAGRSYELGRFAEAEGRFRQLAREQPENALCHQGLGLSLLRLGHHDEAASAFAKALEFDPQLSISHGALGQIHMERREYEIARTELKTALQINPDDLVARTTLGVLYLKQRLYDEAMREFQQAMAINPQWAPTYINLGDVYVRIGRLTEGLSAYWKAMKVNPRVLGYVIGRTLDVPVLYMQRLPTLLRISLAIILALLVAIRNPLSWPIWCILSVGAVVRSIICILVERRIRTGVFWLLFVIVFTAFFLLWPL